MRVQEQPNVVAPNFIFLEDNGEETDKIGGWSFTKPN
jgi:hypothetical protein